MAKKETDFKSPIDRMLDKEGREKEQVIEDRKVSDELIKLKMGFYKGGSYLIQYLLDDVFCELKTPELTVKHNWSYETLMQLFDALHDDKKKEKLLKDLSEFLHKRIKLPEKKE